MALIHHAALRVNSEVPDETVAIWLERGWADGRHADTDPDDDSAVPRVLAAADETDDEVADDETDSTEADEATDPKD